MTKDEALKLAMEALEHACGDRCNFKYNPCFQREAITAIKEALAQPEQEPLEYWNAVEGWVKIDEVREHLDSVGCGTIYKTFGEDRVPLYTTPPQRKWVGLTDDEIVLISAECASSHQHMDIQFAKAIEAALKAKNT